MRTHTYWITYEEYLAYGGVPPSISGSTPSCITVICNKKKQNKHFLWSDIKYVSRLRDMVTYLI